MCPIRDRKPGFDSEFTGVDLRIKLRGEIDHHSAAAVRGAIDDMIRAKRPRELVIDMSAVDFMDSSGLGLIMGRYAIMKEMGGLVSVLDPNSATEKIMRLAGLERIVKIKHTAQRSEGSHIHARPAMSVSSRGEATRTSSAQRKRTVRKENGREGKTNEKSKV